MGIVSWILVGAGVGWVASRVAPARLAGGSWALCLAGMAGGFLGGGTMALVTGRGAGEIDPFGVIVAGAGAALLVLVVRRAARAQPRIDRRAR